MDIDEASRKLRDAQAGLPMGHFDFRSIARDLEEIPEAIYQRIVRERRAELKEPLFLYLELLVKVSRDTWDSIKFLCREKLDHVRRVELVYAVPPLARTLLDSLIILIYIFDDRTTNSRRYYAGAWRDRHSEHQRLFAKHGGDPAWKTWFEASEASIEQVAKLANITPAERANPASIDYWPNPGKISGKRCRTKDPKRCDFLRFLNEWFYGTLSGDSHLTFPGLERRGGFYARIADGVDLDEHHKRARSLFLLEALGIYVAMLSEMSGELRFEHEKTRLRAIWSRLSPASVDAAEFFARRYDKWLT